MKQRTEIVHATTVSITGKGVLIVGPSGSGKSSLALQLIGMGAGLVADDRTQIDLDGAGALTATAPDAIRGLIEARGIGLLRSEYVGSTALQLVVDLSQREEQRLPDAHVYSVLGISLRRLYAAPSPHFAAGIWLYVQGTLDMPL